MLLLEHCRCSTCVVPPFLKFLKRLGRDFNPFYSNVEDWALDSLLHSHARRQYVESQHDRNARVTVNYPYTVTLVNPPCSDDVQPLLGDVNSYVS